MLVGTSFRCLSSETDHRQAAGPKPRIPLRIATSSRPRGETTIGVNGADLCASRPSTNASPPTGFQRRFAQTEIWDLFKFAHFFKVFPDPASRDSRDREGLLSYSSTKSRVRRRALRPHH